MKAHETPAAYLANCATGVRRPIENIWEWYNAINLRYPMTAFEQPMTANRGTLPRFADVDAIMRALAYDRCSCC